jgi:PTH2 family peptidyl-tRNA hydrolase
MNQENKLKQILIIRKDLHMRMGKISAQCCHASNEIIWKNLEELELFKTISKKIPSSVASKVFSTNIEKLHEWLSNDKNTKICVYVNSEQELLEIYNKAKEQDILCSLITDSGLTEFNGIPTITCCALGPDYSEILNLLTSHLKLM